MQVWELKELLEMYPDDMVVFIQTTPNDLAQPLTKKAIKLLAASSSERYGLEREKLLLTAYFPQKGAA